MITQRHGNKLIGLLLALFLGAQPLLAPTPALATAADEERSEQYYKEALQFSKEGKANAAIIQLKNALKSNPDHMVARKLLGELYLVTGNPIAAEKEFRSALGRGVKDADLVGKLGRALLMHDKFDDVLKEITADDFDGADKVEILVIRARAHIGLRDIDTAERLFIEARVIKDDDVRPPLGLAQIALTRKDSAKAEEFADTALKINDKSVEALILKGELRRLDRDVAGALGFFDRAIEQKPDNVVARLGRAAALVDLDNSDKALADLQAVFQLVPKHPMANYLSAYILAKRKDYTAAYEALQEAERFLQGHLPTIYLLGAIHYAQGQLEQAAGKLNQYLDRVPGDVGALRMLGATYVRMREPDKAITALAQVIEKTPEDAQVLTLLGGAYMLKGDFNRGAELYEHAARVAPDQAGIRTQLALSQIARGRPGDAAGSLETAVDLDPDAHQAGVLLTLLKLRERRFDEALQAAQKLKEAMPKNPLAPNLIGAAYLGLGNVDKARESFEEALKMRTDFHPARMNLAQIQLAENKFEAAKVHYMKILELSPKNARAMAALAEVSLREKKVDEAVSWLVKAGEASPKTVAARARLIEIYMRENEVPKALIVARELDQGVPNNPQVLEILGRVEAASGEAVNAVSAFQRLVQVDGKSARAHHLLATAQIVTKNIDAARRNLEIAAELDPKYIPGRVALVRMEYSQRNLPRALQLADKLARELPDNPIGETLIGDIRVLQKNYSEAVAVYDRGLAKNDDALLVIRKFTTQRKNGEDKKAIADLSKWLESRDVPGVRQVLASAYLELGRHDESAREWEKLLTTNADDAIALNNLAWLYYRRGDPRGIQYAERALTHAPKSPAVMDTLGWILVQEGQVQRGLDLIRRALDIAPKLGDIRYHLAAALNKLGQHQAARTELRSLLSEGLPFTEKDAALELMKVLDKQG